MGIFTFDGLTLDTRDTNHCSSNWSKWDRVKRAVSLESLLTTLLPVLYLGMIQGITNAQVSP